MQALRFEQLTGLELQAVKKQVGRPLHEIARDGDIELFYVMAWLAERRNGNPQMPYSDVLSRSVAEVMPAAADLDAVDPTTGESGAD